MLQKRQFVGIWAVLFVAVSTCHADWPRFRGPNGSGISAEPTPTPSQWSPEEHIKWKTELPGPGVSSPIVVGDRVLVTCYSGYGVDSREPGDINELKRHLVCVDRISGKILWEKTVDAVQPEDPYSGIGVPSHGYASHTPVSDGENVYVFFGKSGVFAFDLEGNQLWKQSVGTESDRRRWGSSSSPIIHDDLVIVTASAEARSLVGLDKKTGKEVWRQQADGVADVWGTPLLARVDDQRTDLVLGVPYEFWGLDPESGKLRWYAEVFDTDQYSSSVVESDGVIYGIEGRGGGSAAVRVGGRKDVTDSHLVWTGRDSSRFGSPLVYDNRIYYFGNGVANCIRTEDGSTVFKERLPAGDSSRSRQGRDGGRIDGAGGERDRSDSDEGESPSEADDRADRGGRRDRFGGFGGRPGGFSGRGGGFGGMDYSSPVMADGKIYYLKNDGTTFVLRAGDEFDLLATNNITDDSEAFSATPAISDGQIFVRSDKQLYCIAEE